MWERCEIASTLSKVTKYDAYTSFILREDLYWTSTTTKNSLALIQLSHILIRERYIRTAEVSIRNNMLNNIPHSF